MFSLFISKKFKATELFIYLIVSLIFFLVKL